MNKQIKTPIVILLIILALIVGAYWGASVTLRSKKNASASSTLYSGSTGEKTNNYVDDIENDSISDRIYASLLSALDPHSTYLTPKDLTAEMESLRGNFEGVGIVLRMINDTIRAAQIIAGGPAEKAGMEPGDYILSVNGEAVSGVKMKVEDVVKKLRGPRKSVADIKIKRLLSKWYAT